MPFHTESSILLSRLHVGRPEPGRRELLSEIPLVQRLCLACISMSVAGRQIGICSHDPDRVHSFSSTALNPPKGTAMAANGPSTGDDH